MNGKQREGTANERTNKDKGMQIKGMAKGKNSKRKESKDKKNKMTGNPTEWKINALGKVRCEKNDDTKGRKCACKELQTEGKAKARKSNGNE